MIIVTEDREESRREREKKGKRREKKVGDKGVK